MEPLSLHFLHEQAGGHFRPLAGREVVAHYGPVQPEYEAARAAVALHDASYREWLRLTGEDRVSFLHGMVTQDVNGLPEGRAAYAAMVNAKGAMVADARILRRPGALLLDLEPGTGGKVKEFLEKYLISEDAEVHVATGELGLLRLIGPKVREALTAAGATAELPAPGSLAEATLSSQPVILVGHAQLGAPGIDLLAARPHLEALWTALAAAVTTLGGRPLGFDALEVLRIEAGVPRYGQDMVDSTIPLEANLTEAISYNKGCYIGQEVIARATFRGHMNRKLTGLLLGDEGGEVAPGAELRRGDKRVGWITSVADSPRLGRKIALGYVHRDALTPGTELTVPASQTSVRTAPLPFVA